MSIFTFKVNTIKIVYFIFEIREIHSIVEGSEEEVRDIQHLVRNCSCAP